MAATKSKSIKITKPRFCGVFCFPPYLLLAGLLLGRRAIGVELEEERFNQTVNEIEGLQKSTSKQ
ncbi:hypothetical protein [Salmonella enterica]|uniref:hypothetical protein n=1 Tax=Salmonella enterica TaxID=28901 RepID=UPI003D31D267